MSGRATDPAGERSSAMSGTEWVVYGCLAVGYWSCCSPAARARSSAGAWSLGFLGIVLPVLWVVGALLPPRRHAGSSTAP